MSASEKKNYRVKFYVARIYEVEFDFEARDQETADQMAHDMAHDIHCDDFLHHMIDDSCYEDGDIEQDGNPKETETSYTCMQSRRVADWCETWEEGQEEVAR
jgi:transcriptional regulator of met regulon